MPDNDVVQLEVADRVATITINRPDKLNALNVEVLRQLGGLVEKVANDDTADLVIVTGAGDKAFVAGADIKAMTEMRPFEAFGFAQLGHRVFAALSALRQPVIAAVNGFALGGGTELAISCDIIYASERARFGQPEVGLGVMPGFGGTQRLARFVGAQKARELILTGDTVNADEARRIGLAAEVYPHEGFLDRVRERAHVILSRGRLAVFQAKRTINMGLDIPLERGCELERQAFGVLFGTEDQAEGMRAFIEKRKPVFRGR